MAGIGQGHERGDQTNQNDGLADGDVLTSPTLTNFNERGLMNGVVPITLNKYSDSARNTTNSGDCVCTKSSTQSIVIAAGTIVVDGVFYEIGTQTLNAATVTAQYATYNSSTAPTLTSTSESCWCISIQRLVGTSDSYMVRNWTLRAALIPRVLTRIS